MLTHDKPSMKTQERASTLTTREFVREFSDLTRKRNNRAYTIVKYGKPIGIYIPYHLSDESMLPYKKKRVRLKDLEKLRFRGGKNLSQNIDAIVYGVSR